MGEIDYCPCCNIRPEAGVDDDGAWIECPKCHSSTGYCDDSQQARAEWNAWANENRGDRHD